MPAGHILNIDMSINVKLFHQGLSHGQPSCSALRPQYNVIVQNGKLPYKSKTTKSTTAVTNQEIKLEVFIYYLNLDVSNSGLTNFELIIVQCYFGRN